MTRNFIASLHEREADASGSPRWFIQIEFYEPITGIDGDTVGVDLAPGTSEYQAREVVNGLNQIGRRFLVSY